MSEICWEGWKGTWNENYLQVLLSYYETYEKNTAEIQSPYQTKKEGRGMLRLEKKKNALGYMREELPSINGSSQE